MLILREIGIIVQTEKRVQKFGITAFVFEMFKIQRWRYMIMKPKWQKSCVRGTCNTFWKIF